MGEQDVTWKAGLLSIGIGNPDTTTEKSSGGLSGVSIPSVAGSRVWRFSVRLYASVSLAVLLLFTPVAKASESFKWSVRDKEGNAWALIWTNKHGMHYTLGTCTKKYRGWKGECWAVRTDLNKNFDSGDFSVCPYELLSLYECVTWVQGMLWGKWRY